MATYDQFDEIRARDLFMAGHPISKISARDDMPSRLVVTQWAKEGRQTDGIPWREYREAKEQQAVLAVKEARLAKRAETGQKFLDEVKDDLITIVYNQLMVKIEKGDFDVRLADIESVVKLYAMLENDGAKMMEFMAYFSRRMFEITLDLLPEHKMALFKQRVAILQHEITEKLNPSLPGVRG